MLSKTFKLLFSRKQEAVAPPEPCQAALNWQFWAGAAVGWHQVLIKVFYFMVALSLCFVVQPARPKWALGRGEQKV